MFTKWEQKVKEEGNIAAIGDQIVKLIAAEAKNQDQKIILLRYLKEVVFDKKSKEDVDVSESADPTTDQRNHILDMIQEESERLEKEKKEKEEQKNQKKKDSEE